MRWYSRIGRRVWLHEIWCYLFRDQRTCTGPALESFWRMREEPGEDAMLAGRMARRLSSLRQR
jgi:anaerobic magnesium-protoporphyrin IX monomethyl ester cyclase